MRQRGLLQLENGKALEKIMIFSIFVSRSITTVWSSGPLTSGFSRIPRSPVKLCLLSLLRPFVTVVHCLARTSKFQRTKFVSSHQIQKALNLNRPRWALWFFQIQLKETIFSELIVKSMFLFHRNRDEEVPASDLWLRPGGDCCQSWHQHGSRKAIATRTKMRLNLQSDASDILLY